MEAPESPKSVVTSAEGVAFNCQIVPPRADAVEDSAPPPSPKKPKKKCCPMQTDPLPPSSDLVEALPVLLVGIGVAYAVGVVTGAYLFSPPTIVLPE